MNKIMDIQFRTEEERFIELQDLYNGVGYDALYMTHYELAEQTGTSPIDWKQFLMDPRVTAFVAEEIDMLKKSKVALMLKDVETNKNTGQSQLLNTLLNQTKGAERKEGPVFIYTQVPLNSEEAHAENVVVLNGNSN